MVSSTPRPHFTSGKDAVPILQEAGWASGPVWTGGKSRPHRDSIPDRPARSQSLYRLSYRAHIQIYTMIKNGTKRIRKNVIKDKDAKSSNFIRSIYLLIMADSLLLSPSLHFTTLHLTTLLSTSLHFT